MARRPGTEPSAPQPTSLPLLPTAKNLLSGLDRLPTVAQLAVPAEAREHLGEVVSIAQWAAQEKLQDGGAHGAAAGRLAAQLAALNARLEEILAAKQLPSGCLPFTWSQALKRKDSGGKDKAPARLFSGKGSFKLGRKGKAPSQFETLMADIRAAYDAAEVYRSEVKAALAEAAKARYSSPAQRILLMQQESEAPGLGHAVATLEINRRKAGGLWPEGLFAEPGGDALEHVLAHREALAAFWDRFAEGTASGAIDDAWWSSPSGRRWLERGRDYRLLCEPLDIVAHYFAQHAQQGGKTAGAWELEPAEEGAEEEGERQQQPAAVVVQYCEDPLDGLKDPNGARPRRHVLLQQLEKRILRGRPEPSLAKARALADCGGDVFALPGMPALVEAARAAAAEAAAAAALAASAGAAAAGAAEGRSQSPAGGKAGAAAAAAAASAAGKKEEEGGAKPMPWPLPSFVPPTPPQHERGPPPGGRRNGGDQQGRKGGAGGRRRGGVRRLLVSTVLAAAVAAGATKALEARR